MHGHACPPYPFRMEYEEIEVFADLAAERSPIVASKENKKIVVEIKTFAGRSFIRQLQTLKSIFTLLGYNLLK